MTQTSASRSVWQGGGLTVGKSSKPGSSSVRKAALLSFITIVVVCITVLQKICLPLGSGGSATQLEVALPITAVAMALLAFFAKFQVDMGRAGLFLLFLLAAAPTVLIQSGTASSSSALLLFIIYAPLVLYVEVSESTYRNLMKVFLNAMVIAGGIAIIQEASELIWSWRIWPNLDQLVRPENLMQNYIYIQPIKKGMTLMKPNGVFFLEVSFLSQWTAIALALELVYFRRAWRMIFYMVVLVSCFAGTGLLLLAISGPVLLTRLSRRSLALVGVVLVSFIVVALSINWFDQVQHRFMEFQETGSSANFRFVQPLLVLLDLCKKPLALVVGEGPGSGAKGYAEVWWTSTKVAYEYSLIAAGCFIAFVTYVLFKDAPSKRMAFVLLVMMNFMAHLLVPVYPILIFMIGGMFRIRPSSRGERESEARTGSKSASVVE